MNKRTSRSLIAVVALLAVVVLLAVLAFQFHLTDGLHLGNLLQQALEKPLVSADLQLELSDPQQPVRLEAELFRRTDDSGHLYGLRSDPVSLYFSGDRVIFDNGRAYSLDGLLPDTPVTGKSLIKLLPVAEIETRKDAEQTVYLLTLTADHLRRQYPAFPEDGVFTAEFTERGDALTQVDLHYQDAARSLSAQVVLQPQRTHEIPEAVEQARTAEDLPSIRIFEPLMNAMRTLSDQEVMAAKLRVDADCGPVELSTTMPLYRTENGVFLQRKRELHHMESVEFSREGLFGLGYQLCRVGELNRENDSGVYKLVFPAQSIRDACIEMLPEIELLPIRYDDGTLVLTVENNLLRSARVDVSGTMPVIIADVDIALGMELIPDAPGSVAIPPEIQ